MSKLTIVIVTYNSAKIINILLSKIYSKEYNFIISDNGSCDNTIDIITKNFPNVKIIQNKRNIGFARANNVAFNQANTEFVATLNPDCFVDLKDISRILAVMKKNNNIAIASGELYNGSLNEKTQKLLIAKKCEVAIKNYIAEKQDYYYSKFVSGCFMVMRVAIFKKIGSFFDKNFFLYCEDNELCKRVLGNKYKIAVIKYTKICHLGGISSNVNNNKKYNYFILWHKMGWSKLYYTQAVHNKLIAKLRAIRNIIKRSLIIIYSIVRFRKVNIADLAVLNASIAYLIGKKAFDRNDRPNFEIKI